MDRDELTLIWFDYHEVSFSKVEKILAEFDDFEDIFNENKVKNAIFDESIKKLLLDLQAEDLGRFEKEAFAQMNKFGVTPITFFSDAYPQKLKSISDPPLVIYAKGDVSLLKKKSIAIVGTRKPTTYGRNVCEDFTKELSAAGLVTVSGLAYGIDSVVAEKTLECGGKTIAVLAGGLDSIYPAQNTSLARRIVETGGLLLSENRVGVRPQSYFFILRNRIVSALSLGTLIVEAGQSSGTMSTANFALEQSRELFVIPGNITSPQSMGTNSLIDQMPETFTVSPKRILYKLNIKLPEEHKSEKQIDATESKILEFLSEGEKSFDDICDSLNISPSMLSSKLIMLEMFGLVAKGAGNNYYKK